MSKNSETILIVDDEKEIADLVELYLANDGYRIFKFYNAADALACIAREAISLAIFRSKRTKSFPAGIFPPG